MRPAVVFQRQQDGRRRIASLARRERARRLLAVVDAADRLAHGAEGDVRHQREAVRDLGLVGVVGAVPGVDFHAARARGQRRLVGRRRRLAVQLVGQQIRVVAGADKVLGQRVRRVDERRRRLEAAAGQQLAQGRRQFSVVQAGVALREHLVVAEERPKRAADSEPVLGRVGSSRAAAGDRRHDIALVVIVEFGGWVEGIQPCQAGCDVGHWRSCYEFVSFNPATQKAG